MSHSSAGSQAEPSSRQRSTLAASSEQRSAPGRLWHPEVWRGRRWVTGSAYVYDAITGLGEDVWSSGESTDAWSEALAQAYARKHGVDLFAANGDALDRMEEL